MAHPEAVRPAPAASGNGSQQSDLLGGRIGLEATQSSTDLQDTVYVPSDIKSKRSRRTKAAVATIRDAIRDVLEQDHPQTVRQVFYAPTVRGVIKKEEIEYHRTVIRLLVDMREGGEIPFDWLADNTRWQRKPATFIGLDSCLKNTARFYRRDLWAAAAVYVEIWCEKDALAVVLIEETEPYDVPPGGLLGKQDRLGTRIGMVSNEKKRQAISISTASNTRILRRDFAVHQRAKNSIK
jgi:hypothetical protein